MAKPRKPNDLFGTINSINLKTPIEYDKKEASAYMLLLWLSHDKDLRFYVDQINSLLFELPDELTYKYFYDKIPKKRRYIKWIKKSNVEKEKQEQLVEFAREHGISKKEAMLSFQNL